MSDKRCVDCTWYSDYECHYDREILNVAPYWWCRHWSKYDDLEAAQKYIRDRGLVTSRPDTVLETVKEVLDQFPRK